MDDVFEYRVLFFCMGNICRSLTAHAVLRQRLQSRGLHGRVAVDSAGTHAYHIGEPPDPRSQYHAQRRGYDLSDLRARQLAPADFERAHLLLAMDWDNLALAEGYVPACASPQAAPSHGILHLTRQHGRAGSYGGGADGFERVLDLIEDACDGLVGHIERVLAARRPTRH